MWLAASNLPHLYWPFLIVFFFYKHKLKWTLQNPEITLWLTLETRLEPKMCRWLWQLHSAIASSLVPIETRLIHCFWHRGLQGSLWKHNCGLKCSVLLPTVKIHLVRFYSSFLAIFKTNTYLYYYYKPTLLWNQSLLKKNHFTKRCFFFFFCKWDPSTSANISNH